MSKINIGNDLYLKGRIGWKGLSKSEYLDRSNYRIINATSLEDKLINWDICGYITKDRYEESPEIQLKEKDILISKDGTLGKIGYVKNLSQPSTVASGVFVLRNTKNSVLDTDYLYHFLKSDHFKLFISRIKADGSTINHLYQRDLSQFTLELPPLDTQKKISAILSSIDAKIEINNKINTELEIIANTLYTYWFVQFDFPSSNGTPYKSNNGKMVINNEIKREIPEDWVVKNLSYFVNIYDSKRIPLSGRERQKKQGTFPYHGATEVMDYVDDYIFDGEYILLAEDGSVMDSSGYPNLQYVNGKFWVNNHAHVLQAKDLTNNEYLYRTLKYIPVVKMMTGSVQMKVNQENLMNTKILIPQTKILSKFHTYTAPIRNKMIAIKSENQKLTDLRNWLLPMLMNGQVTIRS